MVVCSHSYNEESAIDPDSSPSSTPQDDTPELRIVFMGTPAFAVPTLRALLDIDRVAGRAARVVAVVTQPDRPAGRGGRVQAGPVKALAVEAGIPVLQPERLRRPENVEALRACAPDLIVVAAFAQILSRDVLEMPPHGCLNVHASLLPRWRGAAPISAAVLAGDSATGVTIMRMDPGLDTGPMLARRVEAIRPDDTTGALTERLAALGAELLAETLASWISGAIVPQPQDEAEATLTRPLRKEDGLIAWPSVSALTVARMAHAYDPWPGAYTTYMGRSLKLWQADPLDAPADAAPGQVLTREQAAPLLADLGLRWPHLLVACRDGVAHLRRVQLEGKRPMSGEEFMRGQQALAGARLG